MLEETKLIRLFGRTVAAPRSSSPLLRAALVFVILALLVFIRSETTGSLFGFETPRFHLEKGHWIVLFGVFAAMTGWLITSIVAIRNSVRQHTMNVLLQSRLSSAYVERAEAVYARYFHPLGLRLLTEEEVRCGAPETQLPALLYLLRHLEFIAVGIRYGDLDETLLRRTLRDTVCSLYEACGALHAPAARGAAAAQMLPVSMENLAWLYAYWFDARLQRPHLAQLAGADEGEGVHRPGSAWQQPIRVPRPRVRRSGVGSRCQPASPGGATLRPSRHDRSAGS